MPARTNSYWSGSFTYTSTLTMTRLNTYDNRASLNYYYQVETMPTRLPSLTTGPSLAIQTAPSEEQPLLSPPPVVSNALSAPRVTGATTFSAAGTLGVELNEVSASIQVPISGEHAQAMAQVARGATATIPGSTLRFRAVHLVLDQVEMTKTAREGGFFYNIYLNLPSGGPGSTVTSRLIGTLGPFKIAAAEHHAGSGARLRYPITDMLAGVPFGRLGLMTVSFVRVSGETGPSGQVISIGEARIELAAEDNPA
jgi:tyrosinase